MNNNEYKYYPNVNDPNLQNRIYEKREFYANRMNELKKDLTNYDDIKEFRDNICTGDFKLYSHQSFLANYINPNTPYKGILIFHGVGTGKTGSAISIAENFKDMVLKYGNKIHILVPGPLIKKNWKSEIIKFNNKNYYENLINQTGVIVNKKDIENELWNINSQYYKLISYRSFYKKVLGEKIKDISLNKKKVRKIDGIIERDIPIDRLENLDNTLLIVDEAHNLTNNEYGLALKKLLNNSKNLKLVLLSATPMKNLASDIIELINFLRPTDDPIKRELIFNNPNYGYLLEFKDANLDYFIKKINGYISYYRGAHPLLFAKQIDMGEIPSELKFTKVIKCIMGKFQLHSYKEVQKKSEDSLEKGSESVANFVFPGLDEEYNLIGLYGNEGTKKLKIQLENNKDILLKLLNKTIFDNKIEENNLENILSYNEFKNSFKGFIFKNPYIKHFSSKIYKLLNNINDLVEKKKGSKTIFIYSNLVQSGINILEEVLIQNGYLEYREDNNYEIYDDTIDYKTGEPYSKFKKNNKLSFKPATFLKITGQIADTEFNDIEIKKNIIDNVFNNLDNIDGKNLKIILGSKVMNEGITLENTGEVHILDVHYNLGRTYQVIGRAIRQCKHYNITNKNNPFPEVKIYKYIIGINNEITSEELLYKKAEFKYLLINKIERILKENAIDCPINYTGNIFKDEILKYKNCEIPNLAKKQNFNNLCPANCDFLKCSYICNDNKLNTKYYDKNSNLYKIINKKDLDYSTFTIEFAKNEIKITKEFIKKLFKIKYVYIIEEILSTVKKYFEEKNLLFDDFFVYQGLTNLIPKTENDFNNFTDIIYDRYNRNGYLIYINKYYIFQPFDLDEKIPLYYRSKYESNFFSNIGISNFIKDDDKYKKYKKNIKFQDTEIKYNFKTYSYYYDNRDENIYVGIIDQINYQKRLGDNKIDDIFKIRSKKEKNLEKKRGTGIPSSKGAVCGTAKEKNELLKICKILNINIDKKKNREEICKIIRNHLLYLEKYNTNKNKKTYMIIPSNHKYYKFPLNLEDRILFINDELNKKLNDKIKLNIIKTTGGIFEDKRDTKYTKYIISFINKEFYKKEFIEDFEFKLKNGKWELIVE